ncbi:MAG TPA: FUSC family protein [Nocardioidaceae bacterium]|nr:FUSC family protein [Nocardioidaceae bacterium]
MTELHPWDVVWNRGRTSMRMRLDRLKAKRFHIAQCAVAAGVAWLIAKDLLDHTTPFFAPVTAVVSLGTSYGQRLRRVAEVTLGVAIGVLIADLLVLWLGSGWWQLMIIVALAMSTALLLDAGALFVTQAAVQSIVIASLVPDPGEALVRWSDALVGGGVALVAATVVPRAPLRRPREEAARVVRKVASLLRGAAAGLETGDVDTTMALLADARATDVLIRELQDASAEGLSVLASSPFRMRHKGQVRQMAELVEPLDYALRNTRLLVRRVAVAAYRRQPVPHAYALLCTDLADAADLVAEELESNRMAVAAQEQLLRLAAATSEVERSSELSAEVVLAQLRSIIADLLRITGMGVLESTDAIPPLR